jgi:hypothetical protein
VYRGLKPRISGCLDVRAEAQTYLRNNGKEKTDRNGLWVGDG